MALISEWMEQCGKKRKEALDKAGIVREAILRAIDRSGGSPVDQSLYCSDEKCCSISDEAQSE